MNEENIPYERQIFVCTNDRKGEKPSCGDSHGEDIFAQLRQIAKEKGLHPKIRVAQAKCLGKCSMGTTIMIYPEQIWIKEVKLADVESIAQAYIKPINNESKE